MSTDISNLKLNLYSTEKGIDVSNAIIEPDKIGPSFLSVTNNFGLSNIKGVVYADDVISGAVQDEIDKTQNENDTISSIVNENKDGSVFDSNTVFTAKTITFESYAETVANSNSEATTGSAASTTTTGSNGTALRTTTSTTALYKNIQYSNNYDKEIQQNIIQGGIDILVNWLDDYINNYDERVAEGKANGESEVKLSFLLRLRKAIENCDFPIGFGNDEYFEEASGSGYVVLGAYSAAYNTSYYLNPEDHANDNVGALQHTNSSIILNADLFCLNRKYTSQYQVQMAIERGEFDYLFEEGTTQEQINEAYMDIVMASDEVYYNYACTYFASILAHELIHSTHITNEAVTYATCEMIEDDFRDQVVSTNWSEETQAAVDTIFENVDLNSLTYGELYLPIGGGSGVGFHDLGDFNDIASHGHDENMAYNTDTLGYIYKTDEEGNLILDEAGEPIVISTYIAYKAYTNFTTGNTLEDDANELMNFMA